MELAVKSLVLVGGGHAHALVLRMWAMYPVAGVRLTLVSSTSGAPYSGMVPGMVRGVYSDAEGHIDLRRLATIAGARFVCDDVVNIDLANKSVKLRQHPEISYDVVSINIGSTPQLAAVPGASLHAVPVKPIAGFLAAWKSCADQVKQYPARNWTIRIVGAGAGGVELACNIHEELQAISERSVNKINFAVHLHEANKNIAAEFSNSTQQKMLEILRDKNITVHLGAAIAAVEKNLLVDAKGQGHPGDIIFWVTGASAPEWVAQSGLQVDERRFIQINKFLQSVSHPEVFAAGDIATMVGAKRPKAGVFAVRAGKPLYENLISALTAQSMVRFKPQRNYLVLIGTGDGRALAIRNGRSCYGRLFWWLKQRIDRKFMRMFSDLQVAMPGSTMGSDVDLVVADNHYEKLRHHERIRCEGCGGKVSGTILQSVLQRLQDCSLLPAHADGAIGLNAPDDAAVFSVPVGQQLVQTTDYVTMFGGDVFLFGRIATLHAFSDIYAMGANPHSCLVTLVIPSSAPGLMLDDAVALMAGVGATLKEVGATLIGGHSAEGEKMALNITCNGLVTNDASIRKSTGRIGDQLILTKALGTGVVLAAAMQGLASAAVVDEALSSMLQSNQQAAKIALRHQVHAMTDVTGFGLLGHALQMVQGTAMKLKLFDDFIPLLPGVQNLIDQGVQSTLTESNQNFCALKEPNYAPMHLSCYDPQTSGGLLIALPRDQIESCLKDLLAAGYGAARVVGEVTARPAT